MVDHLKVGSRIPCSAEKLAGMLDETRWANEFSWEQLVKIAEYMKLYELTAETVIFSEGETDRYMGIVLKGIVDIYKRDGKNTHNRIARISTSQSLGEMALVDGQPRSAKVIAASEVLLVVLSRDGFLRLAAAQPQVALEVLLKISQMLSLRLRQTSGQLVDFLGAGDS